MHTFEKSIDLGLLVRKVSLALLRVHMYKAIRDPTNHLGNLYRLVLCIPTRPLAPKVDLGSIRE